jgi:hypothetical protein
VTLTEGQRLPHRPFPCASSIGLVEQPLVEHQLEVLQLDPPRQGHTTSDAIEYVRGDGVAWSKVAGIAELDERFERRVPGIRVGNSSLVLDEGAIADVE